MRGGLVVALAAILVVALSGYAGWRAWSDLGDVEISAHGYIAMGLGVSLSLALGVGLMMLVFHSHRHGYDDIEVRDE